LGTLGLRRVFFFSFFAVLFSPYRLGIRIRAVAALMLPPRFQRRLDLFTQLQRSLAPAPAVCLPQVHLAHAGAPLGPFPLTAAPSAALKALSAAQSPAVYGTREDPVICARVGGALCGLRDPLGSVLSVAAVEGLGRGSVALEFVRFSSLEGRGLYWHSGAHILGGALEAFFGPGLHLLDGPALQGEQGGFFYDAALPGGATLSEEVYAPVEAAARALIAQKAPFERLALPREVVEDLFSDSPFKLSLIARIPAGEALTVYRCGAFVDLCRGPHVAHTGVFGALKLTRHSATQGSPADAAVSHRLGAPLQRLTAIAFPTPPQLQQWATALEECRQRDHRVVGKAQKLFFFHDLSPGSAFMLPHGTRIINRLLALLRSEYRKRGYEEVATPLLFKKSLWETSGHLAAYAENMYSVKPGGLVGSSGGESCGKHLHHEAAAAGEEEEGEYGLKPMNCPGHCLIFSQRLVTYRDLPLRLADFSALHRNEASGALGGLTRLRRFAQDDAHIFCTEAQIGAEVAGCLDFIASIYGKFGFSFRAVLSTRPERSVGEASVWAAAEGALGEALGRFLGQGGRGGYEVDAGGGAFYGPKIDVFVKDAIGREHQCATVQLDFNLPVRFSLSYRTAAGGEVGGGEGGAAGAGEQVCATGDAPSSGVPVMIHRAVLGSLERFLGILIEHTGGKWPFWLSPRQVLLCTVASRHEAYARRVQRALSFPPLVAQADCLPQGCTYEQGECGELREDSSLWVEIDASSRTVNKKVREGQGEAFNLLVVLGDEEESGGTAAVRFRDAGTLASFEACLGEVAPGVGAWKGRREKGGDAPAAAPAAAAFASPIVSLPVADLARVCQRMLLRQV
jgi:threonyl-tRNA synthetase